MKFAAATALYAAELLCVVVPYSYAIAGGSDLSMATLNDLPIPAYAKDVIRRSLPREDAHQINFKIAVDYPDSSVIEYYTGFLTDRGWSECVEISGSDESDWSLVINMQENNDAVTALRRKEQYLASKGRSQLLLVSLQYTGEPINVAEYEAEKYGIDMDEQSVIVILYDIPKGEFHKTISLLSLTCK